MTYPTVVVAAAVIRDGMVLVGRRRRPSALAGRWELPGGKVEDTEPEPAALRREIHEELGADIEVAAPIGDAMEITTGVVLHTYLARLAAESPEPAVGPDHDRVQWVTPEGLDELDWLDADKPVVECVREHLLDGEPLAGGNVGGAVRIGDTVRRPTGTWTPTIHAFLDHLAATGLDGIPQVRGVDRREREVLSYLPGRTIGDLGAVANVDSWPGWAFSDQLLVQVGRWLHRFHSAARSFRPEGELRWRAGMAPVGRDEVVVHNDVAPYNAVVDEAGDFVGMLDWDLARPGRPLDDVAFAAWNFVPFLSAAHPPERQSRRLRLLASAYDTYTAAQILEAVPIRMGTAVARIRAGAAAGDPGMRRLVEIGEMDATDAALARLAERMPELMALL